MRILIADPHPVTRLGLGDQIRATFPGAGVTEVASGSGNEALRLLGDEQWDLFVTEIVLSGRDGLQVIRRMRRRGQRVPALVVSRLPEEVYAVPALRAGASGFIQKTATIDSLETALRRVSSGHRYISPVVAELLADEYQNGRAQAPHERLTDRELQVFLMLATGEKVSLIAQELSVARKTIYTHRSRILRKLGARTDRDLARYAFANRLIQSRRLSDNP